MKYAVQPYMELRRPARLTMLAKLFIAILLIAVFEGAIRKWISKDLTNAVIALRDGIAAYGILWGLVKGHARYSPTINQILLFSTCILTCWGLIQLVVNQSSPLLYLLGLRFWLLYLWFAFFAAMSMTAYDFMSITRLLLLLLMVMSPLAVIQHFLPPDSFWNKQVDEGFIFRVSGDIVRTTGTFSFTAGYTTFLAIVTPFVFSSLDPHNKLWRTKRMSYIAAAALLVATIVSGSRGAIVFFAILFLFYSGFSMRFSKGANKLKSLTMILLIVSALVVSFFVFSRAVDATHDRFVGAYEVEDPVVRLLYNIGVNQELTFLGFGVGTGNNFATMSATDGVAFMAESETGRMFFEIGALGVLALILKIVVLLTAGRKTLRFAKKTGSISTALIWATIGYALLIWPIVGQLTINVLGYLLVGLGIAALRLEAARTLR